MTSLLQSRSRAIVVAACAALALAATSSAQTPPAAGASGPSAIRLTVSDAVDRALRTSHRIGEVAARQDAATAAVASRDAADRPIISLLGGYTRTNHVVPFGIPPNNPTAILYPDVPDNWRARIDLQWPIYTFGRIEGLERAAKADALATGKDVETAKADVRLDATRAFWALVTARESVRVVEEALKLVESHLKDVKNMFAVGMVAPNDVLSVEAQVARERVLLIDARNMRDVAEADLRRATGIPAETAIEIDASLDQVPASAPEVGSLLAEAKAARTERQALQARATGLDERKSAVAAGLKPIVAVAAGYDYAKPNPKIFPRTNLWMDSWDLGVNVSWPLWDGGRVKADVAEVAANKRAVDERLADFDTALVFEVRQRRLDLDAARASIAAAGEEVAAAAEARRVVTERFKAGLVTNTEVLDAQQALLVAELQRTQAQGAARLAQARLDRAVGR
jgi:outer membrane protein